MAKYTVTFAADASLTQVCTVNRSHDLTEWYANAFVYGTFGGGTVTLHVSPDGGTTKVPLLNSAGTAISIATTAAMVSTARLGNGAKNDDALIIYATLAGSTTPDLTLAIFDNR